MTRLLALSCAGLLAVVMLELTGLRPVASRAGAERGTAARAMAPIVQAGVQATASTAQWTRTVLSRPLFTPDRKPVGNTAAVDMGLPRLAGIIASADGAVAIFQPAGNARSVVARHGDLVAGWEVTLVALDAVSLRKANDSLTLRPRFNGAGANGEETASAPRKAPSRWEAAATTGVLRARWSNPQLQP